MARKRMIDPDFWSDEKLGECSRDERLLFMGLISNADDEGRGRANAKLVKSTIFPYDEDIKSEKVKTMLLNLCQKHLIQLYILDEQEFYWMPKFKKHQVINKPQKSKLPAPPDVEEIINNESYGSNTVVIPERSVLKEVNRIEVKRKEEKGKEVKEEKTAHAEFVKLSESEYQKLLLDYGEEDTRKLIEILNNYKGANGKTYKSDYLAILNWVIKRLDDEKAKVTVLHPKGKPKPGKYNDIYMS